MNNAYLPKKTKSNFPCYVGSKHFQTHLQIVEVTHSSDPVHQQGNLGAAVFIWHPGLRGTRLKAPIRPQRRQPPFGA